MQISWEYLADFELVQIKVYDILIPKDKLFVEFVKWLEWLHKSKKKVFLICPNLLFISLRDVYEGSK